MKKIHRVLCAAALLAPFTGAPIAAAQDPHDQGYKLPRPRVSPTFDAAVEFVEVKGRRVAYVASGAGAPIVFIHGNPTSSYLWRNVMPHVAERGRVVALDLPGMGRSSKPRPALRFAQQVAVFEDLVEALGLQDIVLVVHDWGAAIGFDYAARHPGNVRAIAFMEGVLPPVFPQPSFDAMGEEMGSMFRALKDSVRGRELVVAQNMFVEQVLPGFVNRPLGRAELDAYRRPFLNPADREAVLMWPREIPIAGEPADVVERMEAIRHFMTETSIPMLLLYADPGVLVPPALATWYADHIRHVETVFVGQGFHFIQEDQPAAIGRALDDWLRRTARVRE